MYPFRPGRYSAGVRPIHLVRLAAVTPELVLSIMRWSETLDNVSSYAYLDDELVIVFRVLACRPPSSR